MAEREDGERLWSSSFVRSSSVAHAPNMDYDPEQWPQSPVAEREDGEHPGRLRDFLPTVVDHPVQPGRPQAHKVRSQRPTQEHATQGSFGVREGKGRRTESSVEPMRGAERRRKVRSERRRESQGGRQGVADSGERRRELKGGRLEVQAGMGLTAHRS